MILSLGAVFLVAGILFIIRELKTENPLVDFHIFKNKGYSPATKNTAPSDKIIGENSPRSAACVTITLTLNSVIILAFFLIKHTPETKVEPSVDETKTKFDVTGLILLEKG
jgi:hypothetical protein